MVSEPSTKPVDWSYPSSLLVMPVAKGHSLRRNAGKSDLEIPNRKIDIDGSHCDWIRKVRKSTMPGSSDSCSENNETEAEAGALSNWKYVSVGERKLHLVRLLENRIDLAGLFERKVLKAG